MSLVEWQCSCGNWGPLSLFFFCRHCSVLRCHSCAATEIDCTYCPHCLDNIPITEARSKQNLCPNNMCHRCPICFVTLSVRALGEQSHFLVCSLCRWSSRAAGIPDQAGTTWPQHGNPHEKFLRDVIAQMERYALAEKQAKDKKKFHSKRRSNIGAMFSDRFGMQDMISARKKKFEEPVEVVKPWEATVEVPQLPDSIWNEAPDPGKLTTLEQRLRQPLAGSRPLYPLRMNLLARRMVRCKGCQHNLVKFEYSPQAIKFKIHYFARNYVPEFRLTRPISQSEGASSVFLTVSNETAAKTDVILIFDGAPSSVECLTPVVEFSLPVLDGDTEMPARGNAFVPFLVSFARREDSVVFRRRNCVGIRLDVRRVTDVQRFLHLVVKHRNDTTSFEASTDWRQHRLRIPLPSPA